MGRKYQIFVSSTYIDLLEERQCAIAAILDAGHIPAGMELFKAGSASQLDVVKRWIDDSDIFMLVLGGRYGTLEPNSRKGYVEIEYLYALERNMPILAIVLDDDYLARKVSNGATNIHETDNIMLYQLFKQAVMSRMVRKIHDLRDVAISIYSAIPEIIDTHSIRGWVRAEPVSNLHLAKKCSEIGIDDLHFRNAIPPINIELFKAATEIRMIFTSGFVFFRECQESLRMSLTNGATIRIILAESGGEYAQEVMEMQTNNSELYHGNDINVELYEIEQTLKRVYAFANHGRILLGRFNTQFRANMILIDDKFGRYTPTLPPRTSQETVTYDISGQFLHDCRLHFDTLFSILDSKAKVFDIATLI